MNDISVIILAGKRGGFAIVDRELFADLNRFKWRLHKLGYVVRSVLWHGKHTVEYMHIRVCGALFGREIDHRNGFRFDSTRRNLRHAFRFQNNGNTGKHGQRSSAFKGVSWYKRLGKWSAQIHINDRKKHLGLFDSESEAAAAYDRAAIGHFGEFAKLNNPQTQNE